MSVCAQQIKIKLMIRRRQARRSSCCLDCCWREEFLFLLLSSVNTCGRQLVGALRGERRRSRSAKPAGGYWDVLHRSSSQRPPLLMQPLTGDPETAGEGKGVCACQPLSLCVRVRRRKRAEVRCLHLLEQRSGRCCHEARQK